MQHPVHPESRAFDREAGPSIVLENPVFDPVAPLNAGQGASGPDRAAANGAALLENIGDAIYSLAPDWTVNLFNRQAERFFNCRREDVLGRRLWDSFPAARDSELGEALREAMGSREARLLVTVSPSTGRWADTRIFPLDDGGLGVSWRDVTEQKAQEQALAEALKTQDLLYRELTHRAANNFQEVSSRLMLQARETEDAVARDMLNGTATSVHCMALVNRRLYRGHRGSAEQDLGEYLEALAADLASGILPPNIMLTASAQKGVRVSGALASQVGMIVAELVTNACKYGWPGGGRGEIDLTMVLEGGSIAVEVSDNGRGLPPSADLRQSQGLGLRLLERQIASLRGIYIASNLPRGGASFRLRFPAP